MHKEMFELFMTYNNQREQFIFSWIPANEWLHSPGFEI